MQLRQEKCRELQVRARSCVKMERKEMVQATAVVSSQEPAET